MLIQMGLDIDVDLQDRRRDRALRTSATLSGLNRYDRWRSRVERRVLRARIVRGRVRRDRGVVAGAPIATADNEEREEGAPAPAQLVDVLQSRRATWLAAR
jgi:hypothetical protein